MRRYLLMIACAVMCGWSHAQTNDAARQNNDVWPDEEPTWAATWATATEWTGESDMPRESLAGRSCRQIVKVSVGGEKLRLQLSNTFSREPLDILAVYIADALDSCDIDKKTARYLSFDGFRNVTIAAGCTVVSDDLKYKLKPLQRLSITICYGEQMPVNVTSHRGSRTTSYIMRGVSKPKKKFIVEERVDHWYNLDALLVERPEAKDGIVVLGNSITDGRGSTTNAQNRWPDQMAEALGGQHPVLNLGIGGNCVVRGGLSEPALKRFDRDILGQKGVSQLIIFQGTNDIGTSRHAEKTAGELIEAYKTMIQKAHAAGIRRVLGATITPFKGNGWYTPFHETARQVVNEWIRTSGAFDAVIDFDQLVRSPEEPDRLRREYSDDWLHLNAKGYEVMGRFAAEKL